VAGTDAGGSDRGGSGGDVRLVGVHVQGGGSVSADGGRGGGDGGDGGRITIDSIAPDRPAGLSAAGGAAGAAGGVAGRDGDDGLGATYERAALVELHPDNPGPYQASGSVKLDVRAVNGGGGPVDVVVCRRSPASAPDRLGDSALNPLPGARSAAELIFEPGTACVTEAFAGPTAGADQYTRTITQSVPHGHHGWFALAAKRPAGGADCGSSPGACEFQLALPETSSALLGVDQRAPLIASLPPFERNGSAQPVCPNGSRCLGERVGRFEIAADDGNMSGVADVRCRVNGGPPTGACGGTAIRTVELGAGDGLKVVDAELSDAVGNLSQPIPVARWFVDTVSPRRPKIELRYSDRATNGWHRSTPQVTVSSTDAGPSSGFPAGGLVLVQDGRELSCDAATPGSTATTPVLGSCSPGGLPANGVHQLAARARDMAGNVSMLQTNCADGDRADRVCSMRVDSVPPRSSLVVERPLIGFEVTDNRGGSGFDVGRAPSGVRFRVDNGPWQTWRPGAARKNLLPEGTHTVCYHAVDLAGNAEAPHCSRPIRVEAQPPATTGPRASIGTEPDGAPAGGGQRPAGGDDEPADDGAEPAGGDSQPAGGEDGDGEDGLGQRSGSASGPDDRGPSTPAGVSGSEQVVRPPGGGDPIVVRRNGRLGGTGRR
jgi:hypothetical protein